MRAVATLAAAALLQLCAAPPAAAYAGAFTSATGPPVTFTVSVRDAEPLQVLDELYIGYNIDSGSLYHDIQLSNAQFVALAANLAPAQLRVGGSASDSVWYVPDAPDGATQGPTPDPLAPNAAQLSAPGYTGFLPEVTIVNNDLWASIAGFAESTGLQLLWDLNAVDFRDHNGAWDPSLNASALLAYTAAQKLSVTGWELGNEPDLWTKHFGLKPSGQQLAADLRTLQKALFAAGLSTAVSGPSLATYNSQLVQDFLSGWASSGGGALAFTAHAYPLGPPTYAANSTRPSCSVANYLNLTRVNGITSYLGEFSAAVVRYGDASATRMVLEETASNSLGGCVGYSDRYISGFYWMNIMGLVAEAGWQQLNRQDLAGMSFTTTGSQYTLFGPPGWTNGSGLISDSSPHPDYWSALLWRRLMGTRVLSSSVTAGNAAGSFAAHVWCASPSAPGATPGAVTVAFINAYNGSASFSVAGADGAEYALSPRSEFFLTADTLTSSQVYLNLQPDGSGAQNAEARLRVMPDGRLPPQLEKPSGRFVRDDATQLLVPPLSYGFIVLPGANAPACATLGGPTMAPAAPRGDRAFVHVGVSVAGATVVAVSTLAWVRTRGAPSRNDGGNQAKLLPQETAGSTGYGSLL